MPALTGTWHGKFPVKLTPISDIMLMTSINFLQITEQQLQSTELRASRPSRFKIQQQNSNFMYVHTHKRKAKDRSDDISLSPNLFKPR